MAVSSETKKCQIYYDNIIAIGRFKPYHNQAMSILRKEVAYKLRDYKDKDALLRSSFYYSLCRICDIKRFKGQL